MLIHVLCCYALTGDCFFGELHKSWQESKVVLGSFKCLLSFKS